MNKKTFDHLVSNPVLLFYVLLGSCMILMLGYFMLIRPSLQEYEIVNLQREKLKKVFEHKQSMLNEEDYQKQLQDLQVQFKQLVSPQSGEWNLESQLEKVSQIGTKVGLSFEFLRPKSELVTKTYRRNLISLRVLGSYNQLANFLSQLLQANYRTRGADFEIKGINPKFENTTEAKLVMTMELRLYQFFCAW